MLTTQNKHPIARVYDKYLYHEDIFDIVPPGTLPKDSAALVNAFVNNWVRQNVLLAKAELNLPTQLKDIERQISDYRNSLLIYTYEKELVRGKLDTNVTVEEIESYYQRNQNNFELKDYIVQVIYVKLEKNSPELKKVKKWYRSNKTEDLNKLEEYCHKFAVNFFLDSDVWLYFDDLLKEVPVKVFDKERFLKRNTFVEFDDQEYLYFLEIIDFKLKDSISPLSFEYDNIKKIIINQRKLELIKTVRKEIYDDASKRNEFEVYTQ